MVSIMFAASSRIRLSIFLICSPLARRLGSPYCKIGRMMRISTSETMMMTGARRFRTEKFMRSDSSRASRDGCRNRRCLVFARGAAVIAFVDQLDDERFHLHGHHFHLAGKIGEPDQCRDSDRKSEDSCVQCFCDAKR